MGYVIFRFCCCDGATLLATLPVDAIDFTSRCTPARSQADTLCIRGFEKNFSTGREAGLSTGSTCTCGNKETPPYTNRERLPLTLLCTAAGTLCTPLTEIHFYMSMNFKGTYPVAHVLLSLNTLQSWF